MTDRVRVLVAEDSLTVRKHLVEILASDDQIEVIGEAEDGRRAIELCRALRPDVITMDMMMPVMTGLGATEFIMAHFPTPILVVSASTNRGELFKTYEALAAGAVDVLEKPDGEQSDASWAQTFTETVKLVSRIRVITHVRARRSGPESVVPAAPLAAANGHGASPSCRLIALGASTGGPAAIIEVVRGLSPEVQVPVVFVLHINDPFGQAFAEWLDDQTNRRVAFAKDGELVASAAGRVVMAPPGSHLVVRDGRFRLSMDAERFSCRPSVDVLFESVAREFGPSAVAALLTGMGRDGAGGLLQIRQAGGYTIAQDEASSIVYGMPREAMSIGAAIRILPLNEIGPALSTLASSPSVIRT